MHRVLYTLALALLLPWALLHLLWRARRQPEYLEHWNERFGSYTFGLARPVIWLHAVSVGETRAAQPLVALLRLHYPDYQILLTHMTPTGRHTGVELFGDSVSRAYLPYDYPWAVGRFLNHFRPVAGIIMETELWPNLIAACQRSHCPLLLANARLSEKSAQRYGYFSALTRQALRGLTAIAAQTEDDAKRLKRLGAVQVTVTGNLKFDVDLPQQQLPQGAALRARWGNRPSLLAASTRDGEEALLLDALCAQPLPGALLVLVPRHPQRFDDVEKLVAARGLRCQRRSSEAPVAMETQVLLGDSMGEMFAYYAACDVAVMGGSLLDYGSQNLIEACATGVPVLLGPSVFNFADAAKAAVAGGAARQFDDARALVAAAAELLADQPTRQAMGQAGQTFVAHHRGASARTLTLLAAVLADRDTDPS